MAVRRLLVLGEDRWLRAVKRATTGADPHAVVLSYLDDVLILGTDKALVAAQNAAKEEGPPTGFEFNETKNIWYLPQSIQQPAGLQGERVDIPEVMRCEALAPPVLPEPNADPGQFCAARRKKCRQLMADRAHYLERLEELSAECLSKQNTWML